ncbi:hypothetical protein [Streptomyces poriticola]|uniref:hypothetical protein n=1 Tax=Streptomyces poriticola TaxID=3120506 RepID=UPI002FCE1C1C
MPTPYGSRGGMAFGVEELRVLRRALAHALNPSPVSAEDAHDCLRLAESLDEATRESARLRAFLVADLARYRAALPGTAAGYLALLDEALGAGHHPGRDDLAALGALRGNPAAATLLARCRTLTDPGPRSQPQTQPRATTPTVPPARTPGRTRLLALPGGLTATPATPTAADQDPAEKPEKEPARRPAPKPARKPAPQPATPAPATPKRPIPTPGEVFPRRKPSPPASGTHGARPHLAAG